MKKKKDLPVNVPAKYIKRWLSLIVVLLLMEILSGCRESGSSIHFSAKSINSPEQLPSDLAKTQILFIKRQDYSRWLYVTTLGGPSMEDNEVNIDGNGLVLSPDGDYVVYTVTRDTSEGGDGSIWDRRGSIRKHDLSDGSEQEILLWPERFGDENISKPSFFPSGDKLIFSIKNYDTDQFDLATINLDGSNLEIIETKPNTLSDAPKISPDGEKILVVCEGIDADSGKPGFMLCIMNLDGSERILLTNDGNSHGWGYFSPDSQTLYFSESEWGGLLGLINKPRYEIKSIGIDGNNLQAILNWRWPISLLTISEDGAELVFKDTPQDETPPRLYVVQTNGENLRHLAYFDDFLKDWYAESE